MKKIMLCVAMLVGIMALATGCKDEKPKMSPEEEKVQKVIDSLVFPNQDNVRESLTLPTKDKKNGATITWTTDNESVISVTATDLVPAGVVTRQDKDTKVKLTAKITVGEVSKTKEFEFTVKAKKKLAPTTDYLFASFKHDAGPAGQQVWFSTSRDGNFWKDLNNGRAVLSVASATEGDKGIRDPYLIRSPEGDKFYLIATDLCIGSGAGTHDWGTAQNKLKASMYIRVWESDDLVNWSEPWLVKIGVPASAFTWAPEAIWDEETKQYMIYWSAGSTQDRENKDLKEQPRTWYCYTRDFRTVTEPKLYTSSVNGQGMIDMDIIHAGGNTYYRVSSSYPDILIEVSNNGLFGDWTVVSSLQNLGFNYGAAGNETEGIVIVEGPEFFKYNADDSLKDANGNPVDTWGLLVDNYGGKGYLPIMTTDIGSTIKLGEEGCAWSIPEYDFDSHKRHGTILAVTAEEYKAIMAKWGKGIEIVENAENPAKDPVLSYDFESVEGTTIKDVATGNSNKDNATMFGNATVVADAERGNVLKLDGSNGTYVELPTGFFDGRDTMTICLDVKCEMASGNFFTFTYGKDATKYSFLRVRGTSVRNAITKNSYGAETDVACADGAGTGVWQSIIIVIDGKKQTLYVNGILKSEKTLGTSTKELGDGLVAYLGKSFFSGDAFFKGYFDNFKVYNRALSKGEVRVLSGQEESLFYDVTASNCTFSWAADFDNKVINFTFFKNGKKNAMSNVKLRFDLGSKVTVKNLAESYDLTTDKKITFVNDGVEEEWTLMAKESVNPVLQGQFADPDIDYFNGKYYIYPTTDGYPGWGGYQFHCFSSTDLVNWVDEGIILDVKNNSVIGSENRNGIPGVPWAVGNAWAPSIEEKNGKYYFYFCAKRPDGVSCIGVAVADKPEGPFKAMDEPLMTPEIALLEGKISGGQTIDPSIYTEDGKSYMLWGNGYGAIVELGEDMMSLVPGTIHKYSGTTDLRESIIVVKRNGLYHFTWSCDDTGSENYHVNYGTSTSLYGNITYHGTILSKDVEQGILGTGHHSILYMPDTDEYFIAYHRFVTPLGMYTDGFGIHRETCIDRLTFNDDTNRINVVKPTHTGVKED